jgi:response regulator NasT
MSDSISTKRSGGRQVLIIGDETLIGGLGSGSQLEKSGHRVVGQTTNAADAIRLFREQRPDLLLIDTHLAGEDGITLLMQLLKERRVPAIVITAHSDRDLVDRASAVAGVFGYLIKPVSADALDAQIAVAVQRFAEQEQLLQEKQALAQTLEERKLVERAKGIFMRRLNLDEPEAHRRLQQESQKRRIPMAELARRVIESEEMLGGGGAGGGSAGGAGGGGAIW